MEHLSEKSARTNASARMGLFAIPVTENVLVRQAGEVFTASQVSKTEYPQADEVFTVSQVSKTECPQAGEVFTVSQVSKAKCNSNGG